MSNQSFPIIGFIGAGNMASAIFRTMVTSGITVGSKIHVAAPSDRNLQLWKDLGAKTTHTNGDVITNAEVVFLAMKPQQLEVALQTAKESISNKIGTKLFVSLVVGVSIETLQNLLVELVDEPRVVRTVPNTPIQIQEGFTAFCCGSTVTQADVKVVKTILSAGGICEEIPEKLLNAIAAVSGSGPAFIFTVIDALADGAVKYGVPREIALRCSAQMVRGASSLVLQSGKHPGQLKDEVCSPGGSTICGIHALEQAGVRGAMITAVEATTRKAEEIGQKLKQIEQISK